MEELQQFRPPQKIITVPFSKNLHLPQHHVLQNGEPSNLFPCQQLSQLCSTPLKTKHDQLENPLIFNRIHTSTHSWWIFH